MAFKNGDKVQWVNPKSEDGEIRTGVVITTVDENGAAVPDEDFEKRRSVRCNCVAGEVEVQWDDEQGPRRQWLPEDQLTDPDAPEPSAPSRGRRTRRATASASSGD